MSLPPRAGAPAIETIAVISDIHANLEALQTVLGDIQSRSIQRIVCLGDTIGYGPNPCECTDVVREHCEWALMGNHDYACLYEPTNFNTNAETAAFWTREQFEDEEDAELRSIRWKFLVDLDTYRSLGDGISCVHGSPRRPINEYIFPDDAKTAPTKMQQLFERVDRCCLVGHTHVQGVFTDQHAFHTPAEVGGTYRFREDVKTIINVGSVGQPRDRDPRSGYALLHEDSMEFIRLPYDVEAVVEKIKALPDLNDFFGLRLLEGK